jgi:hypothetical protein
MLATLQNVIALEVTTNKKGYHSLHVYELTKGSYGFKSLNVIPEKLQAAQALVGKRVDVSFSIFEGTGTHGKYVSYSFSDSTPTK